MPDAVPIPDRSLLQRIAVGDEQSLVELRMRHDGSVYALAYGVLLDPVLADAVVTETFETAAQSVGEFRRQQHSPFRWLQQIARTIAYRRVSGEHRLTT